jgi:hypothetical protein
MTNTDDPDVNAKRVTWEWFKKNVLSKCKGWIESFKPGRLGPEQEYPTLKFERYQVYDGPLDAQGIWAVAAGVVVIHMREMPDAGEKVQIYSCPRPAKKGSRERAPL